MMGDNRGDSDDSRIWGPVPESWIVGEVFATYWPPSRLGSLRACARHFQYGSYSISSHAY